MTVQQLLTYNMQDIQTKTKPGGWSAHRHHAQMFSRLWGDRQAMSMTRKELEEWAAMRRNERAHATVHHELGHILRAYNLGLDHELIPANPLARVKVKLRVTKRHQVLTPETEAKLQHIYQTRLPMGTMYWLLEKFALLTGCRLGEQAHLRPHHIQGDIMEIPLEGKTGTRLVPLCHDAQAIAQLWIEIAADHHSEYLFWPWNSNPDRLGVAYRHVANIWRRACNLAGVKGLQRRDLRRTFACELIRAGKPIFEVQKLLGHTTPTQTMTYCQVDLDQLRRTVQALNR